MMASSGDEIERFESPSSRIVGVRELHVEDGAVDLSVMVRALAGEGAHWACSHTCGPLHI